MLLYIQILCMTILFSLLGLQLGTSTSGNAFFGNQTTGTGGLQLGGGLGGGLGGASSFQLGGNAGGLGLGGMSGGGGIFNKQGTGLGLGLGTSQASGTFY